MNAFCRNRRRTGFWIAIAVAIAAASSVAHKSHDQSPKQEMAQHAQY